MSRYDTLIIDVMNFAYRTFQHKQELPTYVSKKQVYKNAVCNFIKKLAEIEEEYLHSDGEVFLLFDNPTSRIDLQSSFYFADRKQAYAKYKSDRSKEPKEFYNSIGLLKYYFTVASSRYRTIQLPRLEADDLVEPVLRLYCKDKKALMVTTDYDWARYVSDAVHWMPSGEPETHEQLSNRLGFNVTTNSIVMLKSIFGDTADNIPSIAPAAMQSGFSSLAEDVTDAELLPLMSCKDSNIEKYPVLRYIRDNERQYRINLQLVNSIPVADKHISCITTTGRNSAPALKAVQEAIGLTAEKNVFVFGNIKRPRV